VADAPQDENPLIPPAPERVAARALVLSAVSWRGLIEEDGDRPDDAEQQRQDAMDWLVSIGAAEEMEAEEVDVLSAPVGTLDQQVAEDATWRTEGMVVLAWALGRADLPPVHIECDAHRVLGGLGFLKDRRKTPLDRPGLRDLDEIHAWADTYLTLHWRLREYAQHPDPIDFVAYVSDCTWGPLRLDGLEIIDDDLAIDGVPLDEVEDDVLNDVLGIAQERHQALNWLVGFAPVYSEVGTDT